MLPATCLHLPTWNLGPYMGCHDLPTGGHSRPYVCVGNRVCEMVGYTCTHAINTLDMGRRSEESCNWSLPCRHALRIHIQVSQVCFHTSRPRIWPRSSCWEASHPSWQQCGLVKVQSSKIFGNYCQEQGQYAESGDIEAIRAAMQGLTADSAAHVHVCPCTL